MYVLQGNHNKASKTFKMLCLYWFKKNIDAHALDEFAGIYKATLFSR